MLRSLLLAFVVIPLAAKAYSLGEPRIRGGAVSPPVAYGSFVYVASGISVQVWDVTDAAHPVRTELPPNERTPGVIFGLAVRGDLLYVGWGGDGRADGGGFQIYSLADPAHPARVGEADTSHADVLLTNGDYLYAVDGQLGVTAIDARDPLHPVAVGSGTGGPLPSNIHAAQVAHQTLFVSGSSEIESSWGVFFDLSDPAHPVAVGGIGFGAFGTIGAVSESGYALVLGDASGIYDVRDAANPVLVGTLDIGVDLAIRGASLQAFRGDDLYFFGGEALPVYDLSTPAAPTRIALGDIGTNDLFAVTPLPSGFLATTVTGRGLVIDATTPSAPALRSEMAMTSAVRIADAALDDRNVYAIGDEHALEVFDAASLENVGVLDAPESAEGFALGYSASVGRSDSAAIIAGYFMLFAVDVADRTNPHVIGALPIESFSSALVTADRAYVPTNDGALTVVDISDPAAMAIRGALPGLYYTPLAASGGIVFAFGSPEPPAEGVYIIDASAADRPVIEGAYTPCIGDVFETLAVTSDGATLGVVCSSRVEIVDVRDPSAASLVASYQAADPSAVPTSIAATGASFYLGNRAGIDELDVSDPTRPAVVAHYPTASWVQTMRLAPDGSLLALTRAGMYVLDCEASSGDRASPCRDDAARSRPHLEHSHHGDAR